MNTPGNPTGGLDDLGAAAAWGRAHEVPVFSDECYAEFTWDGPPRSILSHGTDGVVAVHSLSKRSNLAGLRVGFYAGDAELVGYLGEVRKHAGFMVPGPVQEAAAVALGDQRHVEDQRERYRSPAGAHARPCWPPSTSTARCPAVGSTCGPGPPATMPGGWPGAWPSRWVCWSARASSTVRPAPATCAWPSWPRTSGSTWWPGAWDWRPASRSRRRRVRVRSERGGRRPAEADGAIGDGTGQNEPVNVPGASAPPSPLGVGSPVAAARHWRRWYGAAGAVAIVGSVIGAALVGLCLGALEAGPAR